MIKQKFKILFFLPFLISLSSFAENYPSRILFVGNSYLYYNDSIHNHVEKMLIEFYGDDEITTKSATIGGSRLHNHNIDHLLEPKNLQLDQQIDLLIMQGGSGEVLTKKSRKNFEDTSEADEEKQYYKRNIGENLQSAVSGLETAFGQPLGGRRPEPMRIIPGFAEGGDVDEVMEFDEEITQ